MAKHAWSPTNKSFRSNTIYNHRVYDSISKNFKLFQKLLPKPPPKTCIQNIKIPAPNHPPTHFCWWRICKQAWINHYWRKGLSPNQHKTKSIQYAGLDSIILKVSIQANYRQIWSFNAKFSSDAGPWRSLLPQFRDINMWLYSPQPRGNWQRRHTKTNR